MTEWSAGTHTAIVTGANCGSTVVSSEASSVTSLRQLQHEPDDGSRRCSNDDEVGSRYRNMVEPDLSVEDSERGVVADVPGPNRLVRSDREQRPLVRGQGKVPGAVGVPG